MNGDFEAAKLDRLLRDFAALESVDSRLETLRRLIEYWHGPLRPGLGLSDEELQGKPLPRPLRWWYQLGGRRDGVMGGQNFLLAPHELTIDDEGRLTFYVENQAVYLWSTLADGDDPPVWGKFGGTDQAWAEEGMRLTEFLVEICLFEAIFSAPFGAAAGCATESTLARLRGELTPLPLSPWRWPNYPSQFFAREGAFMFAAPYDDCGEPVAFSVWIGAKTAGPLTFLNGIVDDREWEYVAL
jgi:hypothetical protein